MEDVTKRLMSTIRSGLTNYDVTFLDGQMFLLYEGNPFVISVEKAEKITIQTESGTFTYPPKDFPTETKQIKKGMDSMPEPNPEIIKELRPVSLAKLNAAIGILKIENVLSKFMPQKPKKADKIKALAILFNTDDLKNNVSLLYDAIKASS